jgi:haloacid dehalogenase superfamily, subfamily IA, variant 3 with third motif having DD or ED
MPAYLFDLDGTLLDTETVWCDTTAAYLASKGRPVPEADAVAITYGRAWTDVYRSIAARFPELAIGLPAMQAEMAKIFHAARETSDVRIPGSVELLKRLSKTAPCCIVSGSPREHIAEAVEIMDCAPNLAFYIGSEDYAAGKPAPDCFLLAARKLGIPPRDCVVFEDSDVGVAAGKAAGMRVVALSRPCRPKQNVSAADMILENLSDYVE